MGAIITFANQKGGVGKTTSAVNIASCIAQSGKSVLLVDSDPQGNATSAVGLQKKEIRCFLYNALIGDCPVYDAIVKTDFAGLDAIPSNIELAACEIEFSTLDSREKRLKNLLATVKEGYDYIIIDCPPSLGMLTVNSLVASDGVVIPMQCEYFALEGLSQLSSTISRIKQLYNPNLEIVGILITMYNGRLNLSMQVLHEIKKYYSNKLFSTAIQRNVRLSEAPSFGQPINYFDRSSAGFRCYDEVSRELVSRI